MQGPAGLGAALPGPGHGLLPQLLQQLQAQAAARALIPVDGGGHEHEVGPEERLDEGQRDGRRLVDHHQLCLRELGGVPWGGLGRMVGKF